MELSSAIEDILNLLNTEIAIFDERGSFIFVNKAYIQSSGRSEADIIGKTIQSLFDAGILKNSASGEVYKVRHPITTVIETKHRSGEPLYKLVTATPIFSSTGEIVNVVSEQRNMVSLNRGVREWDAKRIKQRVERLSRYQDADHPNIILESSAMKDFYAVAERVAPTASTILLCGETGTGKEVVAQYIHDHSDREKNMVSINCASLPESLLEAELFGYDRGAFTGALSSGKTGHIELADNSTLLLDEINSMPLNLQAKLLRAIETKTIFRVGATKPKYVNFRLIAATNMDLEHAVQAGTFRADLYYRLNVVSLTIPPLRDRKKDIIPLAKHFLQHYCDKYKREKHLSNLIYEQMKAYSWPGNVRELRNFVENIVVTSPPDLKLIRQIPQYSALNRKHGDASIPPAPGSERERLVAALLFNDGHRGKTADYLGISRRTLQYKVKKYNL